MVSMEKMENLLSKSSFHMKKNCINTSYSCWLSTEHGTIFAFVAPVILIIIVSHEWVVCMQ